MLSIQSCFKLGSATYQVSRLSSPAPRTMPRGLLNTAIEHENPVIFLERSSLFPSVGEVPDNHYTIEFGEASVRRTGSDVTVVATSTFVTEALKAADIVGEDGN